jgi:hypothetical protein
MDELVRAQQESRGSKWSSMVRSPLSWPVTIGLGFIGLYLLLSHTGHLLGALPYLLLLACPLMHLVTHRSHGRRGGLGR